MERPLKDVLGADEFFDDPVDFAEPDPGADVGTYKNQSAGDEIARPPQAPDLLLAPQHDHVYRLP